MTGAGTLKSSFVMVVVSATEAIVGTYSYTLQSFKAASLWKAVFLHTNPNLHLDELCSM